LRKTTRVLEVDKLQITLHIFTDMPLVA